MSDEKTTPAEKPTAQFADLGLADSLQKAVEKMGFESCTPIQAAGIPPLLEGRSVIGRARTGSGKTAAFGLPLLQICLDSKPGPVQGLILAPTRELALQVHTALETYAVGSDLRILAIYGGAPYPPQLRALRHGVDVVVGTPGRVLDHMQKGTLDLSSLKMLVLDEADEMLRMGFIEDVETVFAAVPDDCKAALFSATMPPPIARIAKAHMTNPLVVQVESKEASSDHIRQVWMRVPQEHKMEGLLRLLRSEDHDAVLIFARTRKGCAEVAAELSRLGFASDELHGDLSQAARERVLERLRAKRLQIVVATDVAARGIDVAHITHVVNLDLPQDRNTYVHRIGRTGRAGREGTAATFVTPRENRKLEDLMRILKLTITQVDVASDAVIARRQQKGLVDRMGEKVEKLSPHAVSFLDRVMEERGWSQADIAAVALELLARSENVNLSLPDEDHPPIWARSRKQTQRQTKPQRMRQDAPSGPGEGGHVELFFPVGRFGGVEPGDFVAALTKQAGIPPGVIGRITVVDRKSFVALPQEFAERVISQHRRLTLRGEERPVFLAKPQGDRPPFRPRGGPNGNYKGRGATTGGWKGKKQS
jgi:ATP-dependent RNA helicase DeaD